MSADRPTALLGVQFDSLPTFLSQQTSWATAPSPRKVFNAHAALKNALVSCAPRQASRSNSAASTQRQVSESSVDGPQSDEMQRERVRRILFDGNGRDREVASPDSLPCLLPARDIAEQAAQEAHAVTAPPPRSVPVRELQRSTQLRRSFFSMSSNSSDSSQQSGSTRLPDTLDSNSFGSRRSFASVSEVLDLSSLVGASTVHRGKGSFKSSPIRSQFTKLMHIVPPEASKQVPLPLLPRSTGKCDLVASTMAADSKVIDMSSHEVAGLKVGVADIEIEVSTKTSSELPDPSAICETSTPVEVHEEVSAADHIMSNLLQLLAPEGHLRIGLPLPIIEMKRASMCRRVAIQDRKDSAVEASRGLIAVNTFMSHPHSLWASVGRDTLVSITEFVSSPPKVQKHKAQPQRHISKSGDLVETCNPTIDIDFFSEVFDVNYEAWLDEPASDDECDDGEPEDDPEREAIDFEALWSTLHYRTLDRVSQH